MTTIFQTVSDGKFTEKSTTLEEGNFIERIKGPFFYTVLAMEAA